MPSFPRAQTVASRLGAQGEGSVVYSKKNTKNTHTKYSQRRGDNEAGRGQRVAAGTPVSPYRDGVWVRVGPSPKACV